MFEYWIGLEGVQSSPESPKMLLVEAGCECNTFHLSAQYLNYYTKVSGLLVQAVIEIFITWMISDQGTN